MTRETMKPLDAALIDVIKTEITASFAPEEISEFADFEEFFDVVDVQNAYETAWKPRKWKPYFKAVFDEIRK